MIESLAARGTEAVILGCTELPVLLADEQSALPLLDSTRLLAGGLAALRADWDIPICVAKRVSAPHVSLSQ